MKTSFPWLVLASALCCGCGDRGGFGSGGFVVDRAFLEEHGIRQPERRAERDPEARRETGEAGRETERSSDSRSGSRPSDFGRSLWPGDANPRDSRPADREEESTGRGSDSLPSRGGRWGNDRPMPSRTENWGKDRPMPGDSMPSRRDNWGMDRRMPSDSMPSRSFPRRSDPSDDSE